MSFTHAAVNLTTKPAYVQLRSSEAKRRGGAWSWLHTNARQHRPQPELILPPVDTQQPVVAEVEGRRRLSDEAGRTRSAERPAVVA